MANIIGTTGNDTLNGTANDDFIFGDAGNDKITGGLGADTLLGGEGDDEFLSGSAEIVAGETIDGGSGKNQISVYGTTDLSVASLSNIQTLTIHPAFIPYTPEEIAAYKIPTVTLSATQFASLSRVWAVSGFVKIKAANAGTYNFSDKTVAGTTFTFIGSTGNDSFIGDYTTQIIIGGLGADILTGNDGGDVFTYTTRDQSTTAQTDTITDFFKGVDKIDLTGLNFRGVSTGVPGQGWLKLSYNSLLNVTTLADLGGSGFAIKLNGNHLVLDSTDFIGLGNIINGTSGNDSLPGTSDKDIISGLDGNDVLQGLGSGDIMLGGNGNDEFLVGYNEAIGDVIDGGTDNNKISSWNADLSQTSISNVQTLVANLERVTLTAEQFASFTNLFNYGMNPVSVRAATAGSYSLADKNVTGAFNLIGSSGNDYLAGDSKSQTQDGGDGSDVLQGLGGADTMLGGNGDDEFFVGFNEAIGDVIDGGSGNNKISSWNVDLSQANISNVQTLVANLDKVTLTAAQFTGFTTLINYGSNPVMIQAATAGVYNLTGKLITGTFNLVGSSGNDTLTGNVTAQSIMGGLGADTLSGNAGADIFVYAAKTESTATQTDLITDFVEGMDKIDLTGLGFRGITMGVPEVGQLKVSYDAILNITTIAEQGGANFAVKLQGNHLGISSNDFTGLGSIISGTSSDDYLVGISDTDIMNGFDGNDVLQGLGGADKMYGGNGDDEFLVGGDEVAAGEIIDGGAGNNTISTWGGDLSKATITNVQTLGMHLDKITLSASQLASFSNLIAYDGVPVTLQAASAGTYDFRFKSLVGSFKLNGSVQDDTLGGSTAISTLSGGAGNDLLLVDQQYGFGFLGTQNFLGGDGNDTFQISHFGYGEHSGVNLDGGSGVNTLFAWYSADLRSLGGIEMKNVQVLKTTSIIVDSQSELEIFDKIVSNNGIPSAVPGLNATIEITAAGTYSLKNLDMDGAFDIYVSPSLVGNMNLTGNDASQRIISSYMGGDDTIDGQGGNDYLDGYFGNDIIFGGDGDDKIYAGGVQYTENGAIFGNVSLFGQNGNDFMFAGGGNDMLDGGFGNDIIDSGGGNDTFIFGLGYGADSITENDATAGNTDIVSLLSGTTRDQLWFTKSDNDLQMKIIGTSDSVTLKDWYLGSAYHVEQFKTAAGNTLLDSKVQNLVNAMAGLAVPSTTTLSASYHAALDPVIAANWT